LIDISKPAPKFTGSELSYREVARTIALAQSLTYKNSLVALPVPQTSTFGIPAFLAASIFLMRAGIT
jgi:hypothetical protein